MRKINYAPVELVFTLCFPITHNKYPPQTARETSEPIGDAIPMGSILSGNILLKSIASGILMKNDEIEL